MILILLLIPHVTLLFAVCAFQLMQDEFSVQNLGLYLHVDGVSLMIPLPFFREDITGELSMILVSCATMILVTSAAYTGAKTKPLTVARRYKIVAFSVGAGVFLLGLALNLIL